MYQNCELLIFSLNATKEFGEEVCISKRYELGKVLDKIFEDGESYCKPDENVRGKDVFVVQSLHGIYGEDVDKKITKLKLFNNAAKGASAARVTDVIPYLAYGRQDRKDQSRAPLSAQVLAEDLMNSGADRILSIDWHNPAVQNAYKIQVDILAPTTEVVNYLRYGLMNYDKIVTLAPDVGASQRNEKLAHKLTGILDKEIGVAVAIKERTNGEIRINDIIGDVNGAVTITYDDESVTGSTLIGSSEIARKKGAIRSIAIVTHGKFTEKGIKGLESSCLEEIISTDTIWRPQSFYEQHPKFKKISVAPLFGEAIRRIHNSESISSLFD